MRRSRNTSSFSREVYSVLKRSGVPEAAATRLVRKWSKFIKLRAKQGKSADHVARHLVKFEVEHAVRPVKGDPSRGPGGKRYYRHSRDADAPQKGEIFESRYGRRWEVVDVKGEKIEVKPAGHRGGGGVLVWAKSVLRTMKGKPVPREVAEKEAKAEVPVHQKTFIEKLLRGDKFGPPMVMGRPANETEPQGDPGGRRKGRGTRRASHRHGPRRCTKSTVVQSVVFQKKLWTLARAKSWLRNYGFKISKVDVTEKSYRFRQVAPNRVKVVGVKPFKRGVVAIIGCPKR